MWNGIAEIIDEIKKQQQEQHGREVFIITEDQLQQLEKYVISALVLRGLKNTLLGIFF